MMKHVPSGSRRWARLAAANPARADEPPAPVRQHRRRPAAAPPPAVAAPAPSPAVPRPPDRLDLDTASIRGNQELPKVLYIVPWKEPGLAEPAGRPLNSLVDEVLAPVDREVFRRQMRYFDQLYAPSGVSPAVGIRGTVAARTIQGWVGPDAVGSALSSIRRLLTMETYSFVVAFFREGGVFLYPMAAVFVVGVAIAIERYFVLTKTSLVNRQVWDKITPSMKVGQSSRKR